MTFVDLFAGLGGFHIALKRLGHKCVFACEINEVLRVAYKKNHGVEPASDIREVKPRDIPKHDVLCAGFPCQPFSKAGEQQGFNCPRWGSLFRNVVDIIKYRKPKFIILENVSNITKHDSGNTWNGIQSLLTEVGYTVEAKRFSPHQFGIPQVRDRVYILGCLDGLEHFSWPEPNGAAETDIRRALDTFPKNARPLREDARDCIQVWQRFIELHPKTEELPTWPIWSMEFGATYPYETKTPFSIGARALGRYKGSHGISLSSVSSDERMEHLPSHARTNERVFPAWKIKFIKRNRDFYSRHKPWIDRWMPSILPFPSSYQKLEWNCKGCERDIWKYILQFRASGVRVRRPTRSPSLVAMSTSQVPIIAWEQRYMTPRECAKLQSLSSLRHLPPHDRDAFMALGNAVNVQVVGKIAKALLNESTGVPKIAGK